jgi:hypothetical protein
MQIFWENMIRYPKFLITSITGLIVIVFGNIFKVMKKNKKNQVIILLFLLLGFFSFVFIMFSILDL